MNAYSSELYYVPFNSETFARLFTPHPAAEPGRKVEGAVWVPIPLSEARQLPKGLVRWAKYGRKYRMGRTVEVSAPQWNCSIRRSLELGLACFKRSPDWLSLLAALRRDEHRLYWSMGQSWWQLEDVDALEKAIVPFWRR